MEDKIINDEFTVEVADEVATTGGSFKSFGGGVLTGIAAMLVGKGIKKLWAKHKAKKALEAVDEPIDTEGIVVGEKSE